MTVRTRVRVVGHRVLIRPNPVEKLTKGGIVLVVDEVQDRKSVV